MSEFEEIGSQKLLSVRDYYILNIKLTDSSSQKKPYLLNKQTKRTNLLCIVYQIEKLKAMSLLWSGESDGLREHLVDVEVVSRQEPKIRVRDLTRVSDDGSRILRGVTLDIPKGMIFGVIGPSGSGKSTFLRSLNRLWEPPETTVFLDGEDIRNIDVITLRRRVGMLFQLPVLFEGTVADNVRYGPNLRGVKLSDEEVHKLLSLADLDASFAKKTGAELSVGQAQRVALARTLANEPEVLLLDEPTSALDPISTENIEGVIVKLKKQRGITTVIVSHSIKQIQRVADIVCLVVDGEIVEVLNPNELSQAIHPMAQRFLDLSS